jgi:diguanylate cyclase (GGDEF)-like protein
LKKTPPEPPEATRIATRHPDRAAGPGLREDAREILDMIDVALDEQADWLGQWHRAVVCSLPPADEIASGAAPESGRFGAWFDANRRRGLLDEPVFAQLWSEYTAMLEIGCGLASRVAGGERLPADDYDAFVVKGREFAATARRIRDAYQRAMFDLDPLTGVHSRRSMLAALGRERERSMRTGKAAYVALCDVDNFKAVNDAHGHLAGDAVLLAVVGRLIANLRPYDTIYRFGGDEFLLAFPETDGAQAVGIADRLRAAIAGTAVQVRDASALSVTVSFGLCPLDLTTPIETTLRRADEALYRAKHEGRNRVVPWRAASDRDGERHG